MNAAIWRAAKSKSPLESPNVADPEGASVADFGDRRAWTIITPSEYPS